MADNIRICGDTIVVNWTFRRPTQLWGIAGGEEQNYGSIDNVSEDDVEKFADIIAGQVRGGLLEFIKETRGKRG